MRNVSSFDSENVTRFDTQLCFVLLVMLFVLLLLVVMVLLLLLVFMVTVVALLFLIVTCCVNDFFGEFCWREDGSVHGATQRVHTIHWADGTVWRPNATDESRIPK